MLIQSADILDVGRRVRTVYIHKIRQYQLLFIILFNIYKMLFLVNNSGTVALSSHSVIYKIEMNTELLELILGKKS